jgi:hypothetical protein
MAAIDSPLAQPSPNAPKPASDATDASKAKDLSDRNFDSLALLNEGKNDQAPAKKSPDSLISDNNLSGSTFADGTEALSSDDHNFNFRRLTDGSQIVTGPNRLELIKHNDQFTGIVDGYQQEINRSQIVTDVSGLRAVQHNESFSGLSALIKQDKLLDKAKPGSADIKAQPIPHSQEDLTQAHTFRNGVSVYRDEHGNWVALYPQANKTVDIQTSDGKQYSVYQGWICEHTTAGDRWTRISSPEKCGSIVADPQMSNVKVDDGTILKASGNSTTISTLTGGKKVELKAQTNGQQDLNIAGGPHIELDQNQRYVVTNSKGEKAYVYDTQENVMHMYSGGKEFSTFNSNGSVRLWNEAVVNSDGSIIDASGKYIYRRSDDSSVGASMGCAEVFQQVSSAIAYSITIASDIASKIGTPGALTQADLSALYEANNQLYNTMTVAMAAHDLPALQQIYDAQNLIHGVTGVTENAVQKSLAQGRPI